MTFLLMLGTLLVGSYAMVGDTDGGDDTDVSSAASSDETTEETGAESETAFQTLDVFLNGTNDADILSGGEGDDTIFGDAGADTLNGGAGDDVLYSGNSQSFGDDWNHYVGDLTRVDDAGDELVGGEGDDTLWVGANGVATGGEGADTFHTFAGTNPFGEAAEITDFTAGEDSLEIDFPIHEGYYTEDFGTQDAIDTLLSEYDEATDTTLITMEDQEVVRLNGDQTGLSISFFDNATDAANPVWLDVEGVEMTEAEGQAADIILVARELQDIVGELS